MHRVACERPLFSESQFRGETDETLFRWRLYVFHRCRSVHILLRKIDVADLCLEQWMGTQTDAGGQAVAWGLWPRQLGCVPWKIPATQNHLGGWSKWKTEKKKNGDLGNFLIVWAPFAGLEMNFQSSVLLYSNNSCVSTIPLYCCCDSP